MAIVMLIGALFHRQVRAENTRVVIPYCQEGLAILLVNKTKAFREKGEHTPVPTANGKPCASKAWSKPTPGSRPRLLRPRCSCHAKGCACIDGVDPGTPHAGDQVMPSPKAT